jgi:hypothetical protein
MTVEATTCAWCQHLLKEHYGDDALDCLAALSGAVEPTREYNPVDLQAQYRAGMLTMGHKAPRGVPINQANQCPHCHCTKSGDMDIPNSRDEWCDDSDCLCHQEKP